MTDLALFAYLAGGIAVGCMALDHGYTRAVLIGRPVSAAMLLGEWVAGKVLR